MAYGILDIGMKRLWVWGIVSGNKSVIVPQTFILRSSRNPEQDIGKSHKHSDPWPIVVSAVILTIKTREYSQKPIQSPARHSTFRLLLLLFFPGRPAPAKLFISSPIIRHEDCISISRATSPIVMCREATTLDSPSWLIKMTDSVLIDWQCPMT